MTLAREKSKGHILGIIPARGGSKSIPRKNVKEFLGKPLVVWTIEVAKESDMFKHLILSTDDEEIREIGRTSGARVPFLRPQQLASDAAPTAPVIRHALDWLKDHESWTPETVLVLEPTAPGRRAFHIREAVDLLKRSGTDSVASISEVPHHYNPLNVLNFKNGLIVGMNGSPAKNMIHRRQDLPKHYAVNGLIFGCKSYLFWNDPPTMWGDKVLGYPIDPKYNFDIDTAEDWKIAETRMRKILEEEGTA